MRGSYPFAEMSLRNRVGMQTGDVGITRARDDEAWDREGIVSAPPRDRVGS